MAANETRRTSGADPGLGDVALVASVGGRIVRLDVPTDRDAVIGREPPAALVLEDASVSRRHAVIHPGAPPEIEDLESTNGTKVMGRALARGERAPLGIGAVVAFGDVVAFVQAKDAPTDEEAVVSVRSPPRGHVAPPRTAVVRDAKMRELYDLVEVIAPSKLPVLVLGETGVGKDVYAETIHAASPRADKPYVRLNCAALPESLLEAELFGHERGAFTGAVQAKAGLFEAGDGGTVFLDEVGEMSLVTQAKLLRVLENGEVLRIGSVKPRRVDIRVVSATNRDLEALAELGKFRPDLFFRLAGVSVTIPPLRNRPDDVEALANRFLEQAGGSRPLSPDAVAHLRSYRWPGNIRELKNVVERAVLLARGGPIGPQHLAFSAGIGTRDAPPATAATAPRATAPPGPMRDAIADVERARILEAMERFGGNQSRAAKALGISRTTLLKRLDEYGYVRPRKGQDEP